MHACLYLNEEEIMTVKEEQIHLVFVCALASRSLSDFTSEGFPSCVTVPSSKAESLYLYGCVEQGQCLNTSHHPQLEERETEETDANYCCNLSTKIQGQGPAVGTQYC